MKEKRLATILYADLTGFSQLTSKLGPEKVTEFVNECFKTIDSIIHVHDGTILRHEGDRVMAAFGYPKSQGNDSYSAIISALKIKTSIKNLSQPIETHIGIATGEIICDNDKIFGYVIETASSLEEHAPSGEIYVDKNCYELNQTFFDFEKITDDHREYYKILSSKQIPAYYEQTFRNREKEVSELCSSVHKKTKCIIVTGEQGIGKTRFIHEAIKRLNEPDCAYGFLQTSFLTTRSLQFYESILKIINELDPAYGITSDVNLLSEASYNIKLYKEFSEIIFTACDAKPLIILFQYFGRVDNKSLEFFKYLINNIENHAVTLIFEMQKLHRHIFDVLVSVTSSNIKTIELQQLDAESQEKIMEGILNDEAVSSNTTSEILRHADGNPLFLSEICQLVKNQLRSGKKTRTLKIPYRVKEVLNHLIDHIPVGIFNALSFGALYGYTVNKDFFSTAVNNCEEAISYGVENGLLIVSENDFFFKNPFLRDEICNRIPKSAKKEMHRKIASILREKSGARDLDKRIAYHFKECDEYELALHYSLKWAKKMKDIHANEDALDTYDEALIISKKVDNKAEYRIRLERTDILNLLGKREAEHAEIDRLTEIVEESGTDEMKLEVLLCKGRYFTSISDFDAAIKLYETYSKKKKNALVLERLGMAYYSKSIFTKATNILNDALTIARKDKDIQREADIRGYTGVVLWKQGEKEKSLEYSRKALNLYDQINDTTSKARIVANMGNVYYYLSHYDDALDAYEQALQVANEIGDVTFQSRTLTNIGSVYAIMGEYEKSLQYYEQALRTAKSIMNKKWEAIIINNIGDIFGTVGIYDEALTFFNDALKISQEIGDTAGTAIRYGNIGDCYANLENLSKAKEYLCKALDLSTELKVMDWISFYQNELANAEMNSGNLETALRLARDAITTARKTKNKSYEINGLATEALVHFRMNDIKKAHRCSQAAVKELKKFKTIEGSKSAIYYTHYKILNKLAKNDDALHYLQKAYDEIQEQGNRIRNKNLRQSFFKNIKSHKEIVQLWETLKNQK